MGAYEALAASYDRLTSDVDYEATVAFYREILAGEGMNPRTAVDLACGTGSVSILLAKQGLQVTGVDLSEDMLTVAQQKADDMDNPPRFVCQSLQNLTLPRGVDCPGVWIWRCAPWTVWTTSPIPETAPGPSDGSTGH